MTRHSAGTLTNRGYDMFAYELQRIRRAELVQEADNYRLVRRIRRARRAARRSGQEAEGRVSPPGERFARAA
ncbi:hypothetical protein ACFYT4_12380 [Streptomyces sp. NPDC004609]|uniref:hypothetical protein n=1 Tax=Streptomyces sp. NPDC004609 TaxID=3364704 RepID=UPI00368684C2